MGISQLNRHEKSCKTPSQHRISLTLLARDQPRDPKSSSRAVGRSGDISPLSPCPVSRLLPGPTSHPVSRPAPPSGQFASDQSLISLSRGKQIGQATSAAGDVTRSVRARDTHGTRTGHARYALGTHARHTHNAIARLCSSRCVLSSSRHAALRRSRQYGAAGPLANTRAFRSSRQHGTLRRSSRQYVPRRSPLANTRVAPLANTHGTAAPTLAAASASVCTAIRWEWPLVLGYCQQTLPAAHNGALISDDRARSPSAGRLSRTCGGAGGRTTSGAGGVRRAVRAIAAEL